MKQKIEKWLALLLAAVMLTSSVFNADMAVVHAEEYPLENSCKHEDLYWDIENGEHVYYCGDCHSVVEDSEHPTHQPAMGTDIVEVHGGTEHGYRCTFEGCCIEEWDHYNGCKAGECQLCGDKEIHSLESNLDIIEEDGIAYHVQVYSCCGKIIPDSKHNIDWAKEYSNYGDEISHGRVCLHEGCAGFLHDHQPGEKTNSCILCGSDQDSDIICNHSNVEYVLKDDGHVLTCKDCEFDYSWHGVGRDDNCPLCKKDVDDTESCEHNRTEWIVSVDSFSEKKSHIYVCMDCSEELETFRHEPLMSEIKDLGKSYDDIDAVVHGRECEYLGCTISDIDHFDGCKYGSCELCNETYIHDTIGQFILEIESDDGTYNHVTRYECCYADVPNTAHTAVWSEIMAKSSSWGPECHGYQCQKCDYFHQDHFYGEKIGECSLCKKEVEPDHVCTNIVRVPGVEKTCQTIGYLEHYKCTECDKRFFNANGTDETTLEAISGYGPHNFGSNLAFDGKSHYSKCTVCGLKENITPHSWNDWEVGTRPTCTDSGENYRTCQSCNYREFIKTDPYGHDFCEVEDDDYAKTPATCYSAGVYYKSCSRCGEKSNETFVGTTLKDHDVQVGYDENNHWEKCLNEGCTYAIINEKHTYDQGWEVDEEKGQHWNSCWCGAKSPVENHVFDQKNDSLEGAYIEGGTCQEPGIYYKSCVCGVISNTDTFVGPVGGHSCNVYYDDECHWNKCEFCGQKFEIEKHSFDQKNTDAHFLSKDSVCGEKGIYYISCDCGAAGTETFEGPVLNHEFTDSYWSFDDTHHWNPCLNENCDGKDNYKEHSFTLEREEYWFLAEEGKCDTPAKYFKSCACGMMGTETFYAEEAPGHNFANSYWSYDDTYHWRPCLGDGCTETQYKAEHEYKDGVCTICEYKKHVHSLEKVEAKESTCSLTGNIEYYKCSEKDCALLFADKDGKNPLELEDVIIATKPHNYKWSIYEYATTNKTGILLGVCECGAKDAKDIPKIENIENAPEIVEKDNDLGGTLVDNNVFEKVELTEEESNKLMSGSKLEVILDVKEADTLVSDTDKANIESAANGKEIVAYLDITLSKQISTNGIVDLTSNITNTNAKVKISIEVPSGIKAVDPSMVRTYQIARLHDGVVTLLDAKYDAATNTLTFETDQFSTYAIVYTDSKKPVANTGGNSGVSSAKKEEKPVEVIINSCNVAVGVSPRTGDSANILFLLSVMSVSIAVFVVAKIKKKYNK